MMEGYGTRLLAVVIAADLTPAQREAFIDAAVIGRPYAAVAPGMGVSPQMVSIYCRQARQKLARVDGIRELAA